MNTYEYILKKYSISPGHQYIIEIPNMGRNNLAELFSELNFTKGVELGVDRGEYSEILCKANPNLHLYSVDPWGTFAYEEGKSGVVADQAYFDSCYEQAKNRLLPYNATIVRKDSMSALADFEDNSLDFVYIDANHDFVNFTNDLHHWLKKIKVGGIMAGHDYCNFSYSKFNHVKRVVDAYFRSYRMIPYFIAGSFTVDPGMIRDKYRSWFWVKNE